MKFQIVFILLVLLSGTVVQGDSAKQGSVEFSVTTRASRGKYAPRHVLAIWVTDSKGKFVKTLALYARKRLKYLQAWSKQSGGNKADAITGATLRQHKAHVVTWDGCDASGKPMPDGEYCIRVEFSDHNKQGPLIPAGHIKFKKGSEPVSVDVNKLPCFDKMKVDYKPAEK